MKLHTPTAPFLRALDIASKAITGKTTLPELSCVLVRCSPDSVEVIADSLDARISCSFTPESVDETFEFLASPRLLKGAMRGDSAAMVLAHSNLRLTVESGGKSVIATLPTTNMPNWSKDVALEPVESSEVLGSIKTVLVSAGSEATSSMLFWDAGMGRVFATDRKAISIDAIHLPIKEDFVLPISQAKILLSTFEVGDDLRMGMEGTTICVEQGVVRAWFKTTGGTILPYRSMMVEPDVFAKLDREKLVKALDSLEAFCDSTSFQVVTITPKATSWEIATRTAEHESNVVVEADRITDMEPFAASRDSLLRVLRPWMCDTVQFTKTDNTVMITPSNGGKVGICILMRMP